MQDSTSKKTIAIIGAPTSSGNRGVLALASSLASLLSKQCPEAEIVLLVGQPRPIPLKTVVMGERRELRALNYRISFKSGLSRCLPWIVCASIAYRAVPSTSFRSFVRRRIPWIDCLAGSIIVGDVRGGDSFSDIYGMQRFVTGFLCAWTAILVNGKLVQFPQTYGPFKRPLARKMAAYLLRRSQMIIARDTRSQQVAQSLVSEDTIIHLSPDVAFALEPIPPENLSREPAPIIGINVNGLMYNGGYDRKNMFGLKLDYPEYLDRVLTGILRDEAVAVYLVPHTYAPHGDVESDNEACERVKARLPEELKARVTVITEELDQHEIKGLIGRCDGFVGSRMHSCIAALSQGIPCVGLAYSMKFAGVFESVGMLDWVIEARDESTESAVQRTLELLQVRDAHREDLRKQANETRDRLTTVFSQLCGVTNR